MKFLVPPHDALHLLAPCDSLPGDHDANSGRFAHWRQRAITNLATAFGDDSKAVADFEKIRFVPTWDEVSSGPEIELPRPFTDGEKRDAYRRGEQQVKALVDGLRERVRLAIRLEDQQRHRDAEDRQRRIEDEEERQRKLEQQKVQPVTQPKELPKRVFVVHGHDKVLKHTVARVIGALGLEYVILSEKPNKGRTVIEKFQEEAEPAGYAVVLFTGDDLADSQKALANSGDAVPREKLRERARQNVVFELGYFVGSLGRGKVAVIADGGLEWPSDLAGVVYIARDGWVPRLVAELGAVYHSTPQQINCAIAIEE